jgi:hypothetical protein
VDVLLLVSGIYADGFRTAECMVGGNVPADATLHAARSAVLQLVLVNTCSALYVFHNITSICCRCPVTAVQLHQVQEEPQGAAGAVVGGALPQAWRVEVPAPPFAAAAASSDAGPRAQRGRVPVPCAGVRMEGEPVTQPHPNLR